MILPDVDPETRDRGDLLALAREQLKAEQTEQSLDDYMDLATEAFDPFTVDDDTKAAWAMRKLRRAVTERNRVQAAAKAERDRVAEWERDACAGPDRDIQLFEGMLVSYYRQLEARDPSLPKTYKVPGGEIARRKNPDTVTVTDEAAFIAWAEANDPDALNVPAPKPVLNRLRGSLYNGVDGQLLSPDGEVVPGVAHVVGVETYKAKLT